MPKKKEKQSTKSTKITKKVKPKKKKVEKRLEKGIVNVNSSFNNTSINLCDTAGNVVFWATAGSLDFKGTKKATPFAAAQTANSIINKAKNIGLSTIEIRVKGVGSGRESAIRTFVGAGLTVTKISDVTPIPHGGVRAKKVRRV